MPGAQLPPERLLGLAQPRPARTAKRGIAVLEPIDLELQIAHFAQRVLQSLYLWVELPEPQDPQRCPEPPRGHAHLVYRILFRDHGLVPLQRGHLIEEEAGLGHGSLTLPVVPRSR